MIYFPGLFYVFACSFFFFLIYHLCSSWQIVKDWNSELLERAGKFRKQACAIADWDRRILQNRDVLLRLEVICVMQPESV